MAKTTQSFGLPGKRDGSPVTDQWWVVLVIIGRW
jgi:hypothetical protein